MYRDHKRFQLLQGTESGECIVIGNGPSLRTIPRWFLATRPTFGSNRLFHQAAFLPTNYVFYDSFDCIEIFNAVYQSRRFVFEAIRGKNKMPDEIADAYWCADLDRKVGFDFREKGIREDTPPRGVIYHSTAHAAAWLASFLGYSTILLVGVDCSRGNDGLTKSQRIKYGVDREGRQLPPHFFGPKHPEVECHTNWNKDWGSLNAALKLRGTAEIINLSDGTYCDTLPIKSWRDFA